MKKISLQNRIKIGIISLIAALLLAGGADTCSNLLNPPPDPEGPNSSPTATSITLKDGDGNTLAVFDLASSWCETRQKGSPGRKV